MLHVALEGVKLTAEHMHQSSKQGTGVEMWSAGKADSAADRGRGWPTRCLVPCRAAASTTKTTCQTTNQVIKYIWHKHKKRKHLTNACVLYGLRSMFGCVQRLEAMASAADVVLLGVAITSAGFII